MKKVIALLLITVALTACGTVNRIAAHWTGETRVCVDGVRYLQFPSGASVAYSAKTGQIQRCNS